MPPTPSLARKRARPSIAGAIIVTGALGAAVPASAAARFSFDPALGLGLTYTDNVQYLQTAGTDSGAGDSGAAASARLPFRWDLRSGWITLAYAVLYEKHKTLSALDHTDQTFSGEWRATPSRATSLGLRLDYDRSQIQGYPGDTVSGDFFLAPRTNRASMRATLDARHETPSRWAWSGSVAGFADRYDAIEGFDTSVPTAVVQDRSGFGVTFGLSRSVSAANTWGIQAQYSRYDLTDTGIENVADLSAQWSHKFSPTTTMSLSAGAYQRSSRESVVPGEGVIPSYVGWSGGASVSHRFRSASLSADAEYMPTSGGAIAGTSTNLTGSIQVSGMSRSAKWDWSVNARAGRRKPNDPGLPNLTSRTVGGTVEWRPVRQLGSRLAGYRAFQQGGEAGTLNGAFSTVLLSLVWYPLGYNERSRGRLR